MCFQLFEPLPSELSLQLSSLSSCTRKMSSAFVPTPPLRHSPSASVNRSLQGRTIVVTGATRGIGRGLAVGLGELQAHVIVTGRTETGKNSLSETAEAVRKAGGTCDTYVVDHSNDEAVSFFFKSLSNDLSRKGRTLDAFVNNAYSAVSYIQLNASRNIPFWRRTTTDGNDDPAAVWDIVNNVGLRNNYVCSVLATRLMLQSGGTVVNITSFGGLATIFDAAYCIGKTGVDRISAEFAINAPKNVYYVAFCPFTVATAEISKLAEAQTKNTAPSGSEVPTWNLETPLFVGRTLAALLSDSKLIKQVHGRIACAAEIGDKFNIADENEFRPLALRSLRFLASMSIPYLIKSRLRYLFPRRLYVPWIFVRAIAGAVKYW